MEGAPKLDINLSEVQLDYLENANHNINISSGSIRSGKTFVQMWKFFFFLQSEADEDVSILITGKTGDSVERNVIDDFWKILRMLNRFTDFDYKRVPRMLYYKPKRIKCHIVGANDEGAEARIRGMTAQAWLADEGSLHPKSFFTQAVGRVSYGKRKIWITTNPDMPDHYLKSQYMDNPEIDCKVWYFNLTDNPSLDEEYKRTISSTFIGIDYKRYIEGLWVADDESLIVPEFWRNREKVVKEVEMPKYCNKMVSMDVGFRDFTAILFGYFDFEQTKVVIQDEIFLKKANSRRIAEELRGKEYSLWGKQTPMGRYSDTDLILISDLITDHGISFTPTAKDNKDAQINKLRLMVNDHKILIHPRCEKLIKQLSGGVWNTNRTDYLRSEDMGHLDGIDALLYFIRNVPERSNPFPGALEGKTEDGYHINHEMYKDKEKKTLVGALMRAWR